MEERDGAWVQEPPSWALPKCWGVIVQGAGRPLGPRKGPSRGWEGLGPSHRDTLVGQEVCKRGRGSRAPWPHYIEYGRASRTGEADGIAVWGGVRVCKYGVCVHVCCVGVCGVRVCWLCTCTHVCWVCDVEGVCARAWDGHSRMGAEGQGWKQGDADGSPDQHLPRAGFRICPRAAQGWRQRGDRVPASRERGAQPDGDPRDWRTAGDRPHEGKRMYKSEDLSCSINKGTIPF